MWSDREGNCRPGRKDGKVFVIRGIPIDISDGNSDRVANPSLIKGNTLYPRVSDATDKYQEPSGDHKIQKPNKLPTMHSGATLQAIKTGK